MTQRTSSSFPPNTIIAPNSRIVVVANSFNFEKAYPGIPHIGDLGFNLGNGGDAVSLYKANAERVSHVTYSDQLPWPLGADGQGYTLELSSATADLNNPGSWFAGCMGGSPTTATLAPCIPMDVTAPKSELDCILFPNPARETLYVRFGSTSGVTATIQIIDLYGKTVLLQTCTPPEALLDIAPLSRGIYFVKVSDATRVKIMKLNIL
jgi:hypothetical protein